MITAAVSLFDATAPWELADNPLPGLPDVDLLGTWAAAMTQRGRHYGRMIRAGLRFAFYGRVSTEDYQDPVSSRRWQYDVSAELAAGHGRIVVQFFDVGYSRRVAWNDRPEASRQLAVINDPDRGFDAIVCPPPHSKRWAAWRRASPSTSPNQPQAAGQPIVACWRIRYNGRRQTAYLRQ